MGTVPSQNQGGYPDEAQVARHCGARFRFLRFHGQRARCPAPRRRHVQGRLRLLRQQLRQRVGVPNALRQREVERRVAGVARRRQARVHLLPQQGREGQLPQVTAHLGRSPTKARYTDHRVVRLFLFRVAQCIIHAISASTFLSPYDRFLFTPNTR